MKHSYLFQLVKTQEQQNKKSLLPASMTTTSPKIKAQEVNNKVFSVLQTQIPPSKNYPEHSMV